MSSNYKISLVPGHEWLKVDTEGNLWNIHTGNKLSPSLGRNGYMRVTGFVMGKTKTLSVHRALALAFIPNTQNLPTVNHIDADKTNNSLDNLEWATMQDQVDHIDRLGLRPPCKGQDHNRSKHSDEQIKEVCQLISDGYRNCDIEKICGIRRSLVADVRGGRSWTNISKDYNLTINREHRLSEDTVRFVCEELSAGRSVIEIIKKSGNKISRASIYRIKSRETHKKITEHYKF